MVDHDVDVAQPTVLLAVYVGALADLLVQKQIVTKEEIIAAFGAVNTTPLDDEGKAQATIIQKLIARDF